MELDYDYKASSLKNLELEDSVNVEFSGHKPQEGDVIAVRLTEVRGNYTELDLPGGDVVDEVEEGQVVLGVLGNRAGVKGYIGKVPQELEEGDELYFIGSGGIFGTFESATKELGDPVKAEFLGYVRNGDSIRNTKDNGIEDAEEIEGEPEIIAMLATRMDVGKTTLASEVIKRLADRGYDIASLKLTGSARERDRLDMLEAGSKISLDFVDAGLPSTVDDADEVIAAAKGLINEAWGYNDLDVIVVEFGAGLISNYRVQEVLRDLDIKQTVSSVCAVSLDVAGAYGLKKILEEMDYEISFSSGPITDTTAGRSSIEDYVGVPAYNAFRDEQMEKAVDLLEEEIG
jgi:hypothetical protein